MEKIAKNTHMKELSIGEVKNMQIDIMNKIHDFCVSNGINYSLAWGTMLGAVRHKGFIPWDDDIDIMMPRKDYDQLAKGIEQVYNDLWVQSFETDKTYWYAHSKVVRKGTKYTKFGHSSGVHIDVFIWEELPIRKEELHSYFKKWCKINTLIWKTTNVPIKEGENKMIYQLKKLIKKVIYPSRSSVIQMYNSFFHQVKEDELFYYWFQKADGKLMFLTIKDFQDTILMPFEMEHYYCISQYDLFLKQRFGNYMQLPPEEERVLTHNVTYYQEE